MIVRVDYKQNYVQFVLTEDAQQMQL